MKTDVFNIQGEKTGSVELKDAIFARAWNQDLVHQIFVSIEANKRRPWAHAKTRAEVAGGGRKPWKQKGTGRARHGSIRSPIWTGGGVTHGPSKDRDYTKKINKKMMRAAIYSVLSKKLTDGEFKVVEEIKIETGKTKDLNKALSAFFKTKTAPSTLVVSAKGNNSIVRVCKNLTKVATIHSDSIGVYDLLKYKNVLIEKGAIEEIK
ncbi:MAG: 50S ribosomal protein L4 [Candidatus Harrisonbacteria bacterium CG10_big_fil_rev_8_21_14_0_10_45_28]|uniref:Large ribosomal subunit protein uL4 n=1 Tax=Candidatus Harrisonbacteria bacterium CG10_big_fil_rev_8_21_14_0_10_45_28 TaxID=1974586 RepID=A0A2H0UNZ0_9BACT|nr:MAG: 50S ribosomal protein L4 [Candidatus Harrisonbacteria bacterium CG10_big_fil_rev_8_21_14_0_10_45_28]